MVLQFDPKHQAEAFALLPASANDVGPELRSRYLSIAFGKICRNHLLGRGVRSIRDHIEEINEVIGALGHWANTVSIDRKWKAPVF